MTIDVSVLPECDKDIPNTPGIQKLRQLIATCRNWCTNDGSQPVEYGFVSYADSPLRVTVKLSRYEPDKVVIVYADGSWAQAGFKRFLNGADVSVRQFAWNWGALDVLCEARLLTDVECVDAKATLDKCDDVDRTQAHIEDVRKRGYTVTPPVAPAGALESKP